MGPKSNVLLLNNNYYYVHVQYNIYVVFFYLLGFR